MLSSTISLKTMVPFCRQLATVYKAGLPILSGIDILRKEARDPKLKRVLEGMRQKIQQGETLNDAVRAYDRYLPSFFVELVAAGEFGGRLEEIFLNLADYFERRMRLRREMIRSMTLPVIYLIMVIAIAPLGIAAVNSINPENVEAGMAPGAVLGQIMGNYIVMQIKIWLFIGVIAALYIAFKISPLTKPAMDRIPLCIPVVRKLAIKNALSRFARTFALLTRSGVHVVETVKKAADTTDNALIRRDLLRSIPKIERGDSLSEAMRECRFMTPMALEMLHVGEISGKADETLEKVAEYYEDETRTAAQAAAKALGTTVYLALLIAVGMLIINLWSTYYNNLFSVFEI